jgi:hypothetical protein
MSIETAQITAIDSVPFYVDAGIEATINGIVATEFSIGGPALLAEINSAIALPDLSGDLLLQIIADLKAIGKFTGFTVFQTEMPSAVERPVAPGGIAADGSFFSTPTTGMYAVRVYKNGGFVYQSAPKDLSVDRSLINTGFLSGDVMQIALVTGGVVGWWGRITIA